MTAWLLVNVATITVGSLLSSAAPPLGSDDGKHQRGFTRAKRPVNGQNVAIPATDKMA